MTTLAEIEAAVDSLPQEGKQELLVYLVTQLQGSSDALPPPREFTREQIDAWIAKDEEGMKRLREEC